VRYHLLRLATGTVGKQFCGDPYEMKFTDSYGTVVTQFVD
jgi:hypothetical protein